MARRSTTKPVDEIKQAAAENAAADTSKSAGKQKTVKETIKEMEKETVKKTERVKPLEDSDEIEVVSLVPNVSYKDNKTNDIYKWEKVGHVELMTFDTIKNMWRNYKGYFKNMLLKPNDNRVINKLGLNGIYEKYEFLMDESNYTRANISELCNTISSVPNGLKYTICNKIKNLVVSGSITDIAVIRTLEKHLNLDLTSFLN